MLVMKQDMIQFVKVGGKKARSDGEGLSSDGGNNIFDEFNLFDVNAPYGLISLKDF